MTWDLIVVGTGFASAFFLHGWLPRARPDARVLVLERGPRRAHADLLRDVHALGREAQRTYTSSGDKIWRFSLGFGGGSQCWWACTPRHLPEDFELRRRYGVGTDWPLSYDDLEPFYCEVEDVMQVAGSQERTPFPMSRPYPQPPHRLSGPDLVLQAAFPDRFFHQPTARPSVATARRPACCANGVCSTCPIDSKFTILNELAHLYEDPRVTVVTGATVTEVEAAGDVVTGVRRRAGSKEERASADVVALAANALFNPWILLRSGLDHPRLGKGVCEQRGLMITTWLADVDAYQGSTSILGHAYHFAQGPHRAHRAGALVETLNVPQINEVRGKWRRKWTVKFLFEDLPEDRNRVEVDPDDPDRPRVVYEGPSAWTQRSVDDVRPWLDELLAPLAVDHVRMPENLTSTEAHVLCTHPMGHDPATSLTDDRLVHHRYRNLLLLGGGAFPTAPPANPTLTISALALRAGRALLA